MTENPIIVQEKARIFFPEVNRDCTVSDTGCALKLLLGVPTMSQKKEKILCLRHSWKYCASSVFSRSPAA